MLNVDKVNPVTLQHLNEWNPKMYLFHQIVDINGNEWKTHRIDDNSIQ